MNFAFTEEQDQFRSMLRRFSEEASPTTAVRRLMDTREGYDPAVWSKLSTQLGATAIHIPEAYGGAGFGAVELGIAMEEFGRSLLCSPYLGTTVMGATAVLQAGSEMQKQELLPAITTGERLATLAVAEAQGSWQLDDIALRAVRSPDGYLLNGHKSFVVDGLAADLLVVAGRIDGLAGDDAVALFYLGADAPGLERRALESIDATRKLAHLQFTNVTATRLDGELAGAQALRATLDHSAVALASEMAGGAEKLLSTAVDYAGMRVQFGRVIGSFQSIKHRCADLLLEVESAKSAAYAAAQAAAEDHPQASAFASMAKACASDAYMQAARTCIQIHGGIGFTWENDTHLWFKRAKCSEVFLGDPSYHREKMLRAQGILTHDH